MSGVPRVAFVTLGCKVNQAEADAIRDELVSSGLSVSDGEDAQVVVVTTCTVTGVADRKARKAVHHALSLPGAPHVVVTGCMAAVAGPTLKDLGERVIVEPRKDLVAERVLAVVNVPGGGDVATRAEVSAAGWIGAHRSPGSRARVQVKVEDGCDAYCAYCIVPYARGLPRSVPLDDVVRQAGQLAEAGVAEVVLTGINIGRYRCGEARLGDLIEAVASTGIPRIRLSSIEPAHVDERLLGSIARTPAFCTHVHVPLQSGSDTVLRRMGRPYGTEAFLDVLAKARTVVPDVAVTTDVIAGFPGETDAEWAETVAFVEKAGFSRLHVFRYSRREGTRAAGMPGHVSPELKSARAAQMRGLGASLARLHAESRVGKVVDVLVERLAEASDACIAEGTSREYCRVAVPAGTTRVGSLVRVKVEGVDTRGRLIGCLV